MTVESEINTLKQLMQTQLGKTNELARKLNSLLPNGTLQPAVDYFDKVQTDLIATTLHTLDTVALDRVGLFQAIQAVATYADDSDDVSDLDVLLNDNLEGDSVDAAQSAYAALISDRFLLKVRLLDLVGEAGTPPPPLLPPGTIDLPPAGDLQFDEFNSYLAQVETAINFIRDNNAELPSTSSLKQILAAWQNVIDQHLPVLSSDGGATASSGGAGQPTRAVLVDAYIRVDSKVAQLVDDITAIFSDRNLEDLTIL